MSLSSIRRLVVATVLISTVAAVGLGRLTPAPEGRRMPCPPPYASINAFYLNPYQRGSVWVGLEGGPPLDVALEDDELFEYASCSPWRDEAGRVQVVGRWSWGFRSDPASSSYGLARMSIPDGRILDHVETDVVPVSSPCWYPGTRARVLFAAGDGKLYQHAFEPAVSDGAGVPRSGTHPRPLVWDRTIPDSDGLFLAEPNWPSDPGFSHLVFVGLQERRMARGRPVSAPARIWWLRLSDDGHSIVDAGRLIADSGDGGEAVERCPTFGRSRDGRPVLAYHRKVAGRSSELYLVPLQVDPATRRPRPIAGPGTKVAGDCLPTPPIFSRDGAWVDVIQPIGGLKGTVRRIPLHLADTAGIPPSPLVAQRPSIRR